MENLTKRETEILTLVVDELSSSEIAKRLKISQRTVDTHRHNIAKKLKSSSLVVFTKYAIANNLLTI
ncbi:LuxR C-terminal-related transcriptional regulator [Bacteroidota bacterium]